MNRARHNTVSFNARTLHKPGIRMTLAALALMTVSVGCVSRAPSVEVAPGSQQVQQPNSQWTNQGNADQSFTDSGSLTAVLDERVLKDNFNVDTARLTYKFSFLGKTDSGAIRFSGGKSRISLNKLKPNQPGTVTLEISEGNVLRLKGERQGITLRPGQNEMELTLRLVSPPTGPGVTPNTNPGTTPNTNPGTTPNTQPLDTSLSINVGIESNVPPSNQPPVVPQVQPQPPVAPQTQPGTPSQPSQPSQPWNGIGDRGNETWSIQSLD